MKTIPLIQAFAQHIDQLNGAYITAEDVGTTTDDMSVIHSITPHVVGLPLEQNGSGNPARFTAHGVYLGILACVKHRLGRNDISGLKILVQGLGSVGYSLCEILHKNGAQLFVCDINPVAVEKIVQAYDATQVSMQTIFSQEYDIFAPCAMGGILNAQTIPMLNTAIVAGSANNQLAKLKDGKRLQEKNILYAPDYIINAGGLINVSYELSSYTKKKSLEHVEKIHNTLEEVFMYANTSQKTTAEAADFIARKRFLKK